MLSEEFEPFTEYVPGASAVVGNDINVFYATHIIALCCICFSVTAASYVLIQSIRKGQYTNLHERYPLYLAVADLTFGVVHSIDHLVVVTSRKYPGLALSRFLASLVILSWGYQMTINAALAAQCWGRIIMRWHLALGKMEWRLHALVFGTVITLMIIGLSLDALGPGPYYLIFRDDWHTANGAGAGMWLLTAFVLLPVIVLTICATSFFIRRAVNQALNNLGVSPEQAKENRARQADVRMLNFAIIACIQYVPTIIMLALMLFGDDFSTVNKVGYVVALITVNSGGTMNFTVWVLNERARARLLSAKGVATSTMASGKGSESNPQSRTIALTIVGTVSKSVGRTIGKAGQLFAGKSAGSLVEGSAIRSSQEVGGSANQLPRDVVQC